MAVARNEVGGENNIGICYFDLTTFKCYLGSFIDNENSSTLRTCISKIRPVEIIYDES
jgi:DNA mismatch repair ATPase MutS